MAGHEEPDEPAKTGNQKKPEDNLEANPHLATFVADWLVVVERFHPKLSSASHHAILGITDIFALIAINF